MIGGALQVIWFDTGDLVYSILDLGIIQSFKCHPYAILLDKHKEI